MKSRVVLGRNCIWLPDEALNDFFFEMYLKALSEMYFHKNREKNAQNGGGVQGRDVVMLYKNALILQKSAHSRIM